jgi:ribosomal protein S18 acetylase RimI-like enzyme
MDETIRIVDADLSDPAQGAALVELLEAYMRDPIEGGEPPSEQVKRTLVPGLRAHPACYDFLAYAGAEPIGFSICFLGFSTFQARPLINIHDLFVVAGRRGRGVGRRLLERIETKARDLNCCKITLEVLESNQVAQGLYRRFGFSQAEGGRPRAPKQFWDKPLR